jgi:hypothetical protein
VVLPPENASTGSARVTTVLRLVGGDEFDIGGGGRKRLSF